MSFEPDYTFYRDEWHGGLAESEFEAGIPRALSFVRYLMGYNAVKTESQANAAKRAVCAALDAFATYGYEDGGGFRIGDFTAPSQAKSGKQIASEDAMRELSGSGLLWGGLR